MRLTCGVYDDGKRFTHFDSWNGANSHAVLRRPWTGITMYFERACADIDAVIGRVCALHNKSIGKHAHISIAEPEIFEVQPYSEAYGCHPISYSHPSRVGSARH